MGTAYRRPRVEALPCAPCSLGALLRVELADAAGVGGRQAGSLLNVFAGAELAAIAIEESDDITAVAEEVHDVSEVGGVTEADGVPQLVQARQIDNRLPHERIGARRAGDVGAESRHVRPDEDRSAAPPVERDRTHLTVLTRGGGHEIDAEQRVAFRGSGLKPESPTDRTFPHLERPARKV